MASAWDGLFRRVRRRGRPPEEPKRASLAWPNLSTLGQATPQANRVVYKPVPRNLRYFSRTPLARRAINAIRNPLMQIKWEIIPQPGIKLNSELKRQIESPAQCEGWLGFRLRRTSVCSQERNLGARCARPQPPNSI